VSLVIGGLLTGLVSPGSAEPSADVVRSITEPGRVRLAAGQSVELSGWLEALPIGHWAHFTTVGTVRLEVTSSEPVHVTVRVGGIGFVAANLAVAGQYREVASGRTSEGTFTTSVDTVQAVEAAAAADGCWAWPVITAAFDAAVVEVAEVSWRWVTDDVVPQPNSLAVAITTTDRPRGCLRQLEVLGAAARGGGPLDGVLGRVILVDQGTVSVAESPELRAAQELLFDRLTVVRQRDLGVSGGVARGLHEALTDARISHVALLDDVALAQPQGLAHAWAFAQAARRPTLVVGHSLGADEPSSPPHLSQRLSHRIRHRVVPPSVAFPMWWTSIVPREVVEAIGLPLPYFRTADDVEFGLRATAAGFPSVALPVAVSGRDKDADSAESGWPAYFLLRNHIVTALLHDTSPTDRGPAALVAKVMASSLRHLARRQPAEAALGWAVLKDVLHGPGWLHRDLRTARERAMKTAQREIVAPHPVSALAGSLTASARLVRRWSDLALEYRAASSEATSSPRWVQTFAAAAVPEGRPPTWSIVVTSFHSLDVLTRRWLGLLQAGATAGVPAQDVEVIVVDNADEAEVEVFARDQGFGYLPMGSNVGLSAANNRGAELATGQYLLFANPDLGVVVGDLATLRDEIDRTGGIVAPRLDFPDGTPQSAARGEPYFFAKLAHRGLAPKAALERYLWPVGPYESGPVVWCAGGATALSRNVFDRVGGWPEEYFLYMEDVELGVRAGRLGIPVSVTAAVRWVHEWRGDSRQRFNRGQLLHLRSAVRFYTRYPRYLGWPR